MKEGLEEFCRRKNPHKCFKMEQKMEEGPSGESGIKLSRQGRTSIRFYGQKSRK